MATVMGTDIELGKWYPADLPPPDIRSEALVDHYGLILGIQGLGTRSGFYSNEEQAYYWHCERYDSFDDEHIPGWTREQEINNNLEWVYEKARGVSCWLIIPSFDNNLPSLDGSNFYDPDPDEVYGDADDNDENDDIIPFNLHNN